MEGGDNSNRTRTALSVGKYPILIKGILSSGLYSIADEVHLPRAKSSFSQSHTPWSVHTWWNGRPIIISKNHTELLSFQHRPIIFPQYEI